MSSKQLKASVIIDMTGNVTQKSKVFADSISQMEKRSSSAFDRMKTNIGYLSGNLDKMVTRAAVGITAASAILDKSFIKTAAMFERYQIQSAQLFGGDEGGRKALNWAKQNAKATTMSLQEVMQMMTEMKAFGLNPMDGKLKILEDQGAMRGWKGDETHAALLQLEQMYAKGKITMEDARPLLEKGLDVYGYLSKYSGYSEKHVRELGEKGLLGKKALDVVFRGMAKESNGASEKAMKAFDNMISNLVDDWTQWQENVMNRGVFDKVKNKVRQFKNAIEDPGKANQAAHNTAAILNHSIDMATAGAEGLWDVFKGIGNTVDIISSTIDKTTAGIHTMEYWFSGKDSKDQKTRNKMPTKPNNDGFRYLVEGVASLWLGKKVFDFGKPLVKSGWILGKGLWGGGKGLFNGGRWATRKIFGRGKGRPGIGDTVTPSAEAIAASAVLRVFVTNWPGSGYDIGGGGGGKNHRKKGPGKKRGRTSRVLHGGEELFHDGEELLERASGQKGIWNRVKSLFKGTSHMGKALPLVGTALTVASVAMDDTNTERGGDIGGSVGAWVGGALGTLTDEFTGPFGTIVGAEIGQSLGDKLGSMIGSLFDDKKDEQQAQPQTPLNGRIDLNLNLPGNVTLGSSVMSFGGYNPINLTTGGIIP